MNTCTTCGSTLIKMRWNPDCDLLVCNNWQCSAYRTPVETILSDRGLRQQQRRAERYETKKTSDRAASARRRAKIKFAKTGA